jgi:hypothetical protein
MATERGVDGRLLLSELQELLSAGCLKVYKRMADVDRRLRGKGHPESVPLRSIDREIRQIDQFFDERISNELVMWKPKSRLEDWFARSKFWVWVIPVLIGLAYFIFDRL